jgi:hypothetical protein
VASSGWPPAGSATWPRSLTAFNAAVGSFAAATLAPLLGTALVITRLDSGWDAAMVLTNARGVLGIEGLVAGAAFLVRESRLTLAMVSEEMDLVARKLLVDQVGEPGRPGVPGTTAP